MWCCVDLLRGFSVLWWYMVQDVKRVAVVANVWKVVGGLLEDGIIGRRSQEFWLLDMEERITGS